MCKNCYTFTPAAIHLKLSVSGPTRIALVMLSIIYLLLRVLQTFFAKKYDDLQCIHKC